MATVNQYLQSQYFKSPYVELFEIDLRRIGFDRVIRVTANDQGGKWLTWRGATYQAVPVELTGVGTQTEGAMPQPIFKISNISGLLTNLNNIYGNLINASVRRWRTWEEFLDTEPTANPNMYMDVQEWIIIKKEVQTPFDCSYKLASQYDREAIKLPKRQVLTDAGFPGVRRIG